MPTLSCYSWATMSGKVIGDPVVRDPLIGRTTLKINSATMEQAVEEYLRTHVFRAGVDFKVESVKQTMDGQCPVFIIDVLQDKE